MQKTVEKTRGVPSAVEPDETGPYVDQGPPASTLPPLDQMELLIESLDVGIMLVDDGGAIFRSNTLAHQLCALFGTTASDVPPRLWERLSPLVASSRTLGGRFTQAIEIAAPDNRRLYARCRQVPCAAFAVSLSVEALREVDVKRVLAEQFHLSAQEIRIAFLAAHGHRNREIAQRLDIVEGTVKNYLTNVFAALTVRSRTELATKLHRLVDDQRASRE
jgi:DNA-binding CsgD family transcriptional regulator